MRLPYVPSTTLRLAVLVGRAGARLPQPETHMETGLPMVRIDPSSPSAPQQVALALDCAIGRVAQVAGAFAP